MHYKTRLHQEEAELRGLVTQLRFKKRSKKEEYLFEKTKTQIVAIDRRRRFKVIEGDKKSQVA